MQASFNASTVFSCLLCSLAMGSAITGQEIDQRQREQIGDVLGKPVYRDEIRVGKDVSLSGELHRLFTSGAIQKYRQSHKREVTPTPTEVSVAREYFDKKHDERIKEREPAMQAQLRSIERNLTAIGLTKERKEQLIVDKQTVESQLNPPGELFAVWTVKSWKFQRHLYVKYGGGRILWQQAGMEAFDATRKWLESLEKSGKFKITDPKLRSVLYEYWTAHDHGSFLIDDKERIRREFLEPQWLKATSPKK